MVKFICPLCGYSVTRSTSASAALAERLHVTVSHSGKPVITGIPAE